MCKQKQKALFSILLLGSLLMLSTPAIMAASLVNQLKQHPSPYLAMHGEDPVQWQNWDLKLFERARAENKLVFVSIGYFACHWCHVMQRESYQNPEIAALMNEHFIPIKVDRELQPALDTRLIEFVERTRGYSGWPLNVFITPDGYPLLGIVYLPPADFKSLLQNMTAAWEQDRDNMQAMARDAATALNRGDTGRGPDLDARQVADYRDRFVKQALARADQFQGGFGESNKFPMAPQMSLLLTLYEQQRNPQLGEFLRLTLDKMANQGMYDQLRGGFYRYVVDPAWHIPHFEKMLYDNVQLLDLYRRAAVIFDEPRYQQIVNETLAFLQRELRDERGGLISSLSAIDDKGIEGGYYLWSDDELARLLTQQELEVMRQHWGMQYVPELEDGHHPRIAMSIDDLQSSTGLGRAALEKIIASAKQKLLQAQQQRHLPRDGKLLAGWNGLALSALAKATRKDKRFELLARHVLSLLTEKLIKDDELQRAWANGRYIGDATLEDYAYVAAGLWAWAQYTGKPEDLDLVDRLVRTAWQLYYKAEGGWILSDKLLPGITAREPVIADGPLPSASAELIRVSLALAKQRPDKALAQRARSALNRGHAILTTDNFWYATHVAVMLQAVALPAVTAAP